MPLKPAALLLSALLAAGAARADSAPGHGGDGPKLEGSGHVVSQARSLSGFDAIQAEGAIRLEVQVGPAATVTVEVDDNLQQDLATEVRGKTLVIALRGRASPSQDPKVRVSLPALSAVATQGSGGTVIDGLGGGELALRLAGSGGIEASGHVASLGVLLNGSGDMDLSKLAADGARVRLNGSGDVHVNAVRTLEAVVYGTGDIRYRGNATVTSHVYGTGSIDKD